MHIQANRIVYGAIALAVAALTIGLFLPDPIPVDLATVERGSLQVTVDEDGETRIHDEYTIAAPVAGRLMRTELHEGDAIVLGQVLAEVRPLPLSTRERDEQRARVAAAEAHLAESEALAKHAQSDFEQARRERDRQESLLEKHLIPQQTVEQARIAEITSANEAEAARFKVRSAAAEVKLAQAALAAFEGSKDGVPAVIPIQSPADGRVLRILEKNERVLAAGAPIMRVGDPRHLEVVMDVLSAEAIKVRPGMAVVLDQWGGERPLHAQVRTVEPYAFTKVSALGIEEQRVNVIADFIDPPATLGDGYRVVGRIVVWEAEDVLKVPVSSLFRIGTDWCVFVIEDQRARRRTVQLSHRNSSEAKITGGLNVGEQVIRHPSNDIDNGVKVISQ